MLFAMVKEQRPHMDAHAIAGRILSHHLHGIDIDPRAAQLAAVTLILRAWEVVAQGQPGMQVPMRVPIHYTAPAYTPPALNLATTPAHLDAGALERHLRRYPEDEVYRPILQGVFAALEQAPILGSLLKPEEHLDAAIEAFRKQRHGGQMGLLGDERANRLLEELGRHDPDELKRLLLERVGRSFAREANESDVGAQLLGRAASEGVHLLQLLDRHYAVVATNPPYMGSGNMNEPLRKYVEKHYKAGKRDLFGPFILRCLELTRYSGRVAMVTQQSWLFQKSFTDLRSVPDERLAQVQQKGESTGLLRETSLETLAHLGEHAFEDSAAAGAFVAMFILAKRIPANDHQLISFRLVGLPDPISKKTSLLENTISFAQNAYVVYQQLFIRVIQAPILYWLSHSLLHLLTLSRLLEQDAVFKEGLNSTDNSRLLRYEWECGADTDSKWIAHAKGGFHGRWWNANYYRVNWQFDGQLMKLVVMKNPSNKHWSRRMIGLEFFSTPGCYYPLMCRGSLGTRLLESNGAFDSSVVCIFAPTNKIHAICGFFNTHLASFLARCVSQSMTIREGYTSKLPSLPIDALARMTQIALVATVIKRRLVSSDPLERDFSTNCHHMFLELAFSALISVLEATIEYTVHQTFGIAETDAVMVFAETGIPAGWYPFVSGYDELNKLLDNVGLSSLPEEVVAHLKQHERHFPTLDELTRIKSNLRSLYGVGPGAKADKLELEDMEHSEGEGEEIIAGAYIPIPAETFLEELSVKLQIHPISVYWLLEELRAEGVRCKPEEKRLLEDRLTVLVLRLLGHRWPKQIEAGEPLPPWADGDGVIPLTPGSGEPTLADRLRARLRSEEGDLGAQRAEALLQELTGQTLEAWLRRDFFKRHVSQFKKRPIAWHLASSPAAGGRKRSGEPAFECMLYYHATNTDILARIRTQYVDRLVERQRRLLDQARHAADDSAAAAALGRLAELEDFAARLRAVEDQGFACQELDGYLTNEPLDRWSGDGWLSLPSHDDLRAHERAWRVDINDGVRVNIAPLQAAGLLAADVLNKKDLPKAIADRARWRADERRWVRAGKLPRCGWMDEAVPASPQWTELAPERAKERQRLEEKRKKVLADLAQTEPDNIAPPPT
jgi:hypothetical protein